MDVDYAADEQYFLFLLVGWDNVYFTQLNHLHFR